MGRLVALILWALGSVTAHAALIPPLFINSVVALGSMQAVSSAAHHTEWQTVGTGFFYAYLVRDDTDPAKRVYDIYLVTAKHVIREFLAANSDVNVKINPNDSSVPVRNFAIPNRPSSGSGTWFCHPDESIDVAAVPISFDYLKQYGVAPNAFRSDQHAANRGKLRELEVAEGDGIPTWGRNVMNTIIMGLLAVSALAGLVLGFYFGLAALVVWGLILSISAAAILQNEDFDFLSGIAIIVLCLTVEEIAYLIGAAPASRGPEDK
jgi:hypothetical protein